MNLAAELADLAERRGRQLLPAFHEPGRTWTHGEIHDTAARAATVLAHHSVRRGDRVLIALHDSSAWIVAFLGAARLGAVAVLVNPDLAPGEHAGLAADSDPVLVLCPEGIADRFPAPALTGEELLREAARAPRAEPARLPADAPLYVQYTSGTTGEPKGAVHRHRDPFHYHRSTGWGALRAAERDVTLSISRLFFAYGFGNAFVFPLFSGGSAVLLPRRPTPADVREACSRHGVTLLYGVPTSYAQLVAEGDPASLRTVRAAVSAGESLSPSLAERASGLLGAPVLEQIGSTEAGHAFCANTVEADRVGTLGRPVDGYRLRLTDKDGRDVPEGAEGRLWVAGPTLMAGYLNKPRQTSETVVDGWLDTGDLAVREPDGSYVHRGRADDLEMVGGITVAPHEIERILQEHPGVLEAAVAACPDERGATRLRAFVVPREGGSVRPPGAEELLGRLTGRVARYKVPRSVVFVPELPRTPTGKLRRFVLRRTGGNRPGPAE
ncbi:AMP-binding protein [Streptomyces pini]|uniref:Fatty-acyl-CoA synthase/fatty acid CoA ligase FadD22 n=1 Tax=Streptomyces pini TaxID=1520580 RepID=A0A1I4CSE3_9ACTN|nr:AMP-binding protein [Streptomyces pini]SFK82851.1 fatty-acyl-CoA synthase/fatty acid CoA ligase FadD22 [Streptomyces pini]